MDQRTCPRQVGNRPRQLENASDSSSPRRPARSCGCPLGAVSSPPAADWRPPRPPRRTPALRPGPCRRWTAIRPLAQTAGAGASGRPPPARGSPPRARPAARPTAFRPTRRVGLHAGHVHVDVVRLKAGPVQQRAGEPLLVAADHRIATGALFDRIPVPAARAGIHRSEKHKRPTKDPSQSLSL